MATDVSLIGLGAMGSALAAGFLEGGHSVAVWNRTPGKAEKLIEQGAREAASLDEAVAASPLVVSCLLNYEATKSLFDDSAIHPLLAGRALVNSASARPAEVTEFGDFAAAVGAHYLECKLMMYPHAVGLDDTVIYYSGEMAVFEEHRRTLAALGGGSTYLGSTLTAAVTTYWAVWTVYYSALFGFLESAALIRRAGLAISDFLPHALRGLADLDWQLEDVARRVGEKDYSGDQAALAAYVDGFAAMRGTFQEAGLESVMSRAMQNLLTAADHAGHAAKDVAVVVDMLSGEATS